MVVSKSKKVKAAVGEVVIAQEFIVIDERHFMENVAYDNTHDEGDGSHRAMTLTDSYILCFTGRRGSGKTSLITFMAVKAVMIYNKKLVSNFPIEFDIRRYKDDGSTYLQHIKSEPLDFTKLITFDDDYKNVLILIDECADVISHMASQSWKNRLMAAFVRQIRKNNISLFLGTQDLMMIDKSLRWQVDVEVKCKDYSRYGGEDKTLLRGSVLDMDMYDLSGCWTGLSSEERLNYHKDPCVGRWLVRPCFLWGDEEKGIKPAFDSWFQIDILDSLRRYDLKMSEIQIGDKANLSFEAKFPVSPGALERVLETIVQLRQERPGDSSIYQTEFYTMASPLIYSDKNNIGKSLSHFGVERGGDGAKRWYRFGKDFQMANFEQYVRERITDSKRSE